MLLTALFALVYMTTSEAYVEVKTPRDTPYTVRNVIFYHLTGNLTVTPQQDFVDVRILSVDLEQDTWLLLYTKPDADGVPSPPCDEKLQQIPQGRILKVYTNQTRTDNGDVRDGWTIPRNTIMCYQILKKASTGNWGTFKYSYSYQAQGYRTRMIVEEKRPLNDRNRTTIMRTHHRSFSLKQGYTTVIDLRKTMKNMTSLDRIIVTKVTLVNKTECKYVRDRHYSYRTVKECTNVTRQRFSFVRMISAQTPERLTNHWPFAETNQWPLVVTNATGVSFTFEVIEALELKEDVLFAISEFPDCNGIVTNHSGIIVSPGYPTTPYKDNTDCTWTLRVRPGERIQVTFGETESDCGNDYLMLSGVREGSKNQEILCGQFIRVRGKSFTSKANELVVRFRTSTYAHLKGFLLNYTAIGCSTQQLKFPDHSVILNPQREYIPAGYELRVGCKPGYVFPSKVAEVRMKCLPDNSWGGSLPFCVAYTVCSDTLTSPKGYVTSPGYPKSYPRNVTCTWTIQAKVGQRISIRVNDLKSSCLNDFIVIDGVMVKTAPTVTTTTSATLATGVLVKTAPTATTTTTATPATGGVNTTESQPSLSGPRLKRSLHSTKEYICGNSISAGKEYTSLGNRVSVTFRSNIYDKTGYFQMSYEAQGCGIKELRLPRHGLLRNKEVYYPHNYRMTVGCDPGYSFIGGGKTVEVVCDGNKRTWNGGIPLCVRWRTGLYFQPNGAAKLTKVDYNKMSTAKV